MPTTPLATSPIALASPGPLAAAHATLACDACHAGKQVIADKCLDCHREVRVRLQAGKGFHASAVVRGKRCDGCHRDHRGGAYDMTGWQSIRGGRAGFDHALSGWPLDGAHVARACGDCHTAKTPRGAETFVGTAKWCGSCHPNQPHGFADRDLFACDRCHSTQAWQPALAQMRFDHDDRKDARMPMLGAHERVACAACHPAGKFALALSPPDRCDGCHASPHTGHLFGGRDCSTCHSVRAVPFKSADAFDHTEKTRFELGGHKTLECVRCHTKSLGMAKPSSACETCHAKRAAHGARFKQFGTPPACALCHTTSFFAMPDPKWRPRGFDHAKHTKFALDREHIGLTCRHCHRGKGPTDFERLPAGDKCMSCHEHARVHDGRFKNTECRSCHHL